MEVTEIAVDLVKEWTFMTKGVGGVKKIVINNDGGADIFLEDSTIVVKEKYLMYYVTGERYIGTSEEDKPKKHKRHKKVVRR